MTESEMLERMKCYNFYHTIQLTENVQTNGWEVIRPTTDLTLRRLRALDLKGKRVLDVGCRDGLMCFEAERRGAAEVIGIDNNLSIPAVQFLIPCLRSKVRMHELNLFELRPEMFGKFDVIVFAGVLYHLRYPFWALKVLGDMLTEDGTMVLETAVYADNNRLPLLYCPIGTESPYEPTSCTFFNMKALMDTLVSLGFKVQGFECLHNTYPPSPDAPELARAADEPPPIDRAVLVATRAAAACDVQTISYWNGTHEAHSSHERAMNRPAEVVPRSMTKPAAAEVGPERPSLQDLTERLRPYATGLFRPNAAAVLGAHAQEAAGQVWEGRHPGLDYTVLERDWPAGTPLEQFLEGRTIDLLYLNERMIRTLELSRPKEAWSFLNGPLPPPWQCVNGGNESGDRWRLYLKAGEPFRELVSDLDVDAVKREYEQQVKRFHERTAAEPEVANFYWYHTVDLGNGLVTPGDYDYRSTLDAFRFPADMRGMKVLDVGSATGFFAFEFEKRGADVTSVELPSLADWDMVSSDREAVMAALMHSHRQRTPKGAYHAHLEGPFQFCRTKLKSRVKRCHARIYDLSPKKLGADGFDLIFAGDVLLHTFSPLKALDVLAPLCRGTLIVSQEAPSYPPQVPAMLYVGGEHAGGDARSWWLLNPVCLEQMLKRVGFKKVTWAGRHRGLVRRIWCKFDRLVFHATR